MAVNKQLQADILSRLENREPIDALSNEHGFKEELQYLEDYGYVESICKPNPNESYYSTYRITSIGRSYLG